MGKQADSAKDILSPVETLIKSRSEDYDQLVALLQPLSPSDFNSLVPNCNEYMDEETPLDCPRALAAYVLAHPDVPIWEYAFYKKKEENDALVTVLPFSFLLAQSMFPSSKNGGVYLDDEEVRDHLLEVAENMEHDPTLLRIYLVTHHFKKIYKNIKLYKMYPIILH